MFITPYDNPCKYYHNQYLYANSILLQIHNIFHYNYYKLFTIIFYISVVPHKSELTYPVIFYHLIMF